MQAKGFQKICKLVDQARPYHQILCNADTKKLGRADVEYRLCMLEIRKLAQAERKLATDRKKSVHPRTRDYDKPEWTPEVEQEEEPQQEEQEEPQEEESDELPAESPKLKRSRGRPKKK